MASSSATTYGLCRCCLSEGRHKDIMKVYCTKGVREMYYDIILDCFNLFLSTSPQLSTLICKSCIKKVNEARAFKTMVTESERKLLSELGEQDTLCVNVPEVILDIKMEPVEVKIEEIEDHSDARDDHDDVINDFEPSAVNDNEHNVVEEVMDTTVEGEKEFLQRFAHITRPLPTVQTLYTVTPWFAKHLDMLRGKCITSKMVSLLLDGVDEQDSKTEFGEYCTKTAREKVYSTEKTAQISNILALLQNSNVTPFKSKSRTGFPCFYCRATLNNIETLRQHQEEKHSKSDLKDILSIYGAECIVVYVDVTDLKCTICDEKMANLNELKTHITRLHKKEYCFDITDRVIPFKLSDNNVFECQLCSFSFETFGSIERHMNVHYRNYICSTCGTGFVTKYRLKVHVKSMHVDGNFPCDLCKKVFTSQQKRKNHVDAVHKLVKRFKCPKCHERFSEYFKRQKHLVATHGVAPLQYKCNVCEKSFDRRYTLSRHLRRDHLVERDFQCEMCSYKCFTSNELGVHRVKHNGERIFECAVCKKSYARKKTLKEHMRIHNNDRRFACAVCGQAFVQKCSLKGHMKTHHVEYNMTS